jgi:hypothetical protein
MQSPFIFQHVKFFPISHSSSSESCKQAGQIKDDEYEKLDQHHYKVENGLFKLIESPQKKQPAGDWEDTLGRE